MALARTIEPDHLVEALSAERLGSFDPVMSLRVSPEDPSFCEFSVEPLERGGATTLGVAMRRYLYRQAEGYGVVGVWIAGAERLGLSDCVPGLESCSIEYFLAVARTLTIAPMGSEKPAPLRGWLDLGAEGPGNKVLAGRSACGRFAAMDPVGSLDVATGDFRARLFFERGRGYRAAREPARPLAGFFPTEAVYTPIRQANYWVERCPVGARSDLERLRLEVKTNGAVDAASLGRGAASSLGRDYGRIGEFAAKLVSEAAPQKSVSERHSELGVESLGLSRRAENALLRAGVSSVADVLALERREILSIRSFGQVAYLDLAGALRRHESVEPEGHWLEAGGN